MMKIWQVLRTSKQLAPSLGQLDEVNHLVLDLSQYCSYREGSKPYMTTANVGYQVGRATNWI